MSLGWQKVPSDTRNGLLAVLVELGHPLVHRGMRLFTNAFLWPAGSVMFVVVWIQTSFLISIIATAVAAALTYALAHQFLRPFLDAIARRMVKSHVLVDTFLDGWERNTVGFRTTGQAVYENAKRWKDSQTSYIAKSSAIASNVRLDRSAFYRNGKLRLTQSHIGKLREAAKTIFPDHYRVTVTPIGASSDRAVMMSSCAVAGVNSDQQIEFVFQLHQLRFVTLESSPTDLKTVRLTVEEDTEMVVLKFDVYVSDPQNEQPEIYRRLENELALRRENKITYYAGFPQADDWDGISPVDVSIRRDNGSLIRALKDLNYHIDEDEQTSVEFALSQLLEWFVPDNSFVHEGQVIGQFAEQMIHASATGRLRITAPYGIEETSPSDGLALADHQWVVEQHRFWPLSQVLLHPELGQQWTLALVEDGSPDPQKDDALPAVMQSPPDPVAIRDFSDANTAAAEWLRHWGWIDAAPENGATANDVSISSRDVVAQVKAHASPIGRPALQQLFGIASAEEKIGMFFSLAGYTKQAREWADEVDLPLFRFDLQGQPTPENRAAVYAVNQQNADWAARLGGVNINEYFPEIDFRNVGDEDDAYTDSVTEQVVLQQVTDQFVDDMLSNDELKDVLSQPNENVGNTINCETDQIVTESKTQDKEDLVLHDAARESEPEENENLRSKVVSSSSGSRRPATADWIIDTYLDRFAVVWSEAQKSAAAEGLSVGRLLEFTESELLEGLANMDKQRFSWDGWYEQAKAVRSRGIII